MIDLRRVNSKGLRILRRFVLVSLASGFLRCQSTGRRPTAEQDIKLVETTLELAQTQLDQGEPKDALLSLKSIYSSYPDEPKILNTLGVTHLALKNFEKAKVIFEDAYAREPSTMHALNLSAALLGLGLTSKTRALLTALLDDPEYNYKERLLHNIGLSYEQEGNQNHAKSFYKKALVENPIYFLSSLRLGKIYKKQHNQKLALHYFEEASKNCPPCFEPISELVKYHNKAAQFEDSATLLKNFLKQKTPSQKDKAEASSMLSLTRGLYSTQ